MRVVTDNDNAAISRVLHASAYERTDIGWELLYGVHGKWSYVSLGFYVIVVVKWTV